MSLQASWQDCYTSFQVWVSLHQLLLVIRTWLAQIPTEILSLLHRGVGWQSQRGSSDRWET